MSNETKLSFETVNAHVEKYFSTDSIKNQNTLAAPTICEVYKIVRPILELAYQTPLIPTKWREAIKMLISALDVMCPQN